MSDTPEPNVQKTKKHPEPGKRWSMWLRCVSAAVAFANLVLEIIHWH
jgi:hypothetical protein